MGLERAMAVAVRLGDGSSPGLRVERDLTLLNSRKLALCSFR